MPKGAIVAIGGGDFSQGRRFWPSTLKIEEHTLQLAEARKPHDGPVRVLYVPTASRDERGRISDMLRYFRELGCDAISLALTKSEPPAYIKRCIEDADIIYVSGGNTRYMMKMWERHGVDTLIKAAYERGAVLSGYSAGSICWFNGGWSDAEQDEGYVPWYPVWVEGLGLIATGHSPHFGTRWRKEHTRKEAPEGITLALDNNAALIVENGSYRVIATNDDACAYVCRLKGGEYYEKVLPITDPAPIADILNWEPSESDLAPELEEPEDIDWDEYYYDIPPMSPSTLGTVPNVTYVHRGAPRKKLKPPRRRRRVELE